jgi:hypothetical protein
MIKEAHWRMQLFRHKPYLQETPSLLRKKSLSTKASIIGNAIGPTPCVMIIDQSVLTNHSPTEPLKFVYYTPTHWRLLLYVSHLQDPPFIFIYLFLTVLGFELRALALARQAFYHLSHSTSPFLWGFFQGRVSRTICPKLALNLNPSDLCLLSS